MNLRSKIVFLTMMTATLLALAGCNRRTPEEHLQQAQQFLQQNDTLSAEVEAKKIIEKTPDDPVAIQARILLAQIYVHDQRFDEAKEELEPALDKVSQKDGLGRAVLRTYLQVLQTDKKYDEAIKTIDEFQKKYGNDEATSLNLAVAKADTQIRAGMTTQAREVLFRLHDTTTSPAEIELYRGMIGQSYQRDRDTTAAIAFYEKELANAKQSEEKRMLVTQLAGMEAAVDNYPKTREYAMQATAMYDDLMSSEGLDAKVKGPLTFDLAKMYVDISNLSGARRAFQALFDSAPQDPQLIMATVAGLTESLIRQGQIDAAVGFLREAGTRYPSGPFAQQSAQIQGMKGHGRLENMEDTSTLAMKFKAEPIVPKNLPKAVMMTSGTQAQAGGSSGTADLIKESRAAGAAAASAAATSATVPAASGAPGAASASTSAPAAAVSDKRTSGSAG